MTVRVVEYSSYSTHLGSETFYDTVYPYIANEKHVRARIKMKLNFEIFPNDFSIKTFN